jgi:uncharacterized protein (TIRG00374 family)
MIGVSHMKRLLIFLTGIIVFILWLFYVDLREVWEIARATNLAYLTTGFFFFYLSYVLRIQRWQMVLRPILPLPFWGISKYYWASEFINTFTPLRLGEVSKAALLKRDYGIDFGESLSTVVVDRFYGILVRVLVLCCLPLLAINLYPFLKGYLIYAAFLTGCLTLVPALLLVSSGKMLKYLTGMLKFLPPIWLERTIHFVESSLEAIKKVHRRKRDSLTYLSLSALSLATQSLMTYFFFKAAGLEIPFPVFCITTTLVDCLTILPQPPGSLGTTEWYANMIYTFGLGIPKNGVAAITLLTHALGLGILAVLGTASLGSIGGSLFIRSSSVRHSSIDQDHRQMGRIELKT